MSILIKDATDGAGNMITARGNLKDEEIVSEMIRRLRQDENTFR